MTNSYEEKYVAPYEALSAIYDDVMQHVNYNRWLYFVLDVLQDYGLSKPLEDESALLLDCACGTGNFAGLLALNGYKVEAFDGSPDMIRIAQAKLGNMENPPVFHVNSFNSFSSSPRYNAAMCMYDSINYLRDPKRVIDFLKRISNSLKPDGGLFFFDICTEYNSIRHFDGEMDSHSGDGYSYTREMDYDKHEKLQVNRFEIRFSNNPEMVLHETHVQKIYSEKEIESFIRASGMELLEICDGLTRKPPDDVSMRIHFLCKPK